ncbi:Uncharacterised protein [Mycobacteroides abscessus subsp. abscessus]|nr:Uncharacterised protein [Mycobacteroides abscessus subsp. abscessus]
MQVSWESWERQRGDVDRLRALVLHDTETVVALRDCRPSIVQLVQYQLQVLRIHARDRDIAARHRRSETPSGSDDSVSNDAMLGGMKRGNTGYCQRRRSRSLDLGPHLHQHGAQVDHVGFTCRVVDGRHAVSEHRCHQDVLGGAHRRKLKMNIGSV